MLSYKAERAGRRVVKVSQRGTSQENEEKIKDRDYRAAVNILNRGLSGLGRPLAPVEERPLLRISAFAVVTGASFSHEVGSSLRERGVVHFSAIVSIFFQFSQTLSSSLY